MAVSRAMRIDEAYRQDQREAVSVYEVMGSRLHRASPLYWIRPEQEFRKLAEQWKNETRYSSMLRDIIRHDAYQRIIEMGWAVVPLILVDLDGPEPAHWGPALHAITRAQPVPDDAAGRLDRIADAWLQWAAERGYRHG